MSLLLLFRPIAAEAPEPPVVVVEETRRVSGRRRYRLIEDPDKILDEIKSEEKKVEKEKKRLVILTKRAAAPHVEGVLYQQIQRKVEKLEAKIDGRLARMAELAAMIQQAIDDEEDEDFLLI